MSKSINRKAAIVAALASAVAVATPLTLFSRLANATAINSTVRTYERLDDGSELIIINRRQENNAIEVFRRDTESGQAAFPQDGEYRLANGYRFEVVRGTVNADWVASDGGGFQQYHQQTNPFSDTAYPTYSPEQTDRLRFTDASGEQFLVIQNGLGRPYEAYVVDREGRGRLANPGDYQLGNAWGSTFQVRDGGIVEPADLAVLKLGAYEE